MIHYMPVAPRTWLYAGTEDEIEEHNHLWVPFWFLEDEPPFRIGRGRRIRLTKSVAFHIGVARLSGAERHEDVMGDSGQLGVIEPTVIGTWRPPAPRAAP